MINILIIDDEKNALEVLQLQIENYCKNAHVLGIAKGGEEGIDLIKKLQPDLVLLDIEMPHINGFDVLEKTKYLKYKVIFTTAYNQFAIKAFKYAAIDYLLKPIDIIELQNAINQAVSMVNHHDLEEKVNLLWQQLQTKQIESITLPVGNALEIFKPDEIIRCESDNTYTKVHLSNGKKIVVTRTLKEVEDRLKGLEFSRIHQSHLVNMSFIDKFHKTDNPYVTLKNGENIPVSRSKKSEFLLLFRNL